MVQAAQPRIDVVPAVVWEEEGRRHQDTRSHGNNMNLQGESKKSVISKNENRPWWGIFEKKIHDQ